MGLRLHRECYSLGGDGRSVHLRRAAAAFVTRSLFASHIFPLSGPARCLGSFLASKCQQVIQPAPRKGGAPPFCGSARLSAAPDRIYRELDLRSNVDQPRHVLDRRMG